MAKADKLGRGLFGLKSIRSVAAEPQNAPVVATPVFTHPIDFEAASLRFSARLAASNAVSQLLSSTAAPALQTVPLTCHPPTIDDVLSPWFAYWARELDVSPRPHRKLWDFAVVLQALYEGGALKPGAKAVGFGVGDEPLPSYLASLGMEVVASDMPGATNRDLIFQERFLTEEEFDARVEVSDIDFSTLNDQSLRNIDACWSCSVAGLLGPEHVVEEALIRAMDVLRPGGVAVHLVDYVFAPDASDNLEETFLPRSFFERLERAMNGRGHTMAPISFDLGDHPLDAYVDIPPQVLHGSAALEDLWNGIPPAPHLKVAVGNIVITSFPVIVTCRN